MQRLEKRKTTKKLSACFPTLSSWDRGRVGSARTSITVGLGEGKRARLPCAASSKDPYLPAAAHSFWWAGAQPGRATAEGAKGGTSPSGRLGLPRSA